LCKNNDRLDKIPEVENHHRRKQDKNITLTFEGWYGGRDNQCTLNLW
jgi:hypothetical protein